MCSPIQFKDILLNYECNDIDSFLESRGNCLDIKDKNGQTPLLKAVTKGHKDIALALLNHGASIDIPDLNTPLHIAVKKNFLEISALLVERGADIHFRNIHGKSSIELCAGTPVEAVIFSSQRSRAPVPERGLFSRRVDSLNTYQISHTGDGVSASLESSDTGLVAPSHRDTQCHTQLQISDPISNKRLSPEAMSRPIMASRYRSVKKIGTSEFSIEYDGSEVRMLRRSESFTISCAASRPHSNTPVPVLAIPKPLQFMQPKIGEVSAFTSFTDSEIGDDDDGPLEIPVVGDGGQTEEGLCVEEDFIPFSWNVDITKIAGCNSGDGFQDDEGSHCMGSLDLITDLEFMSAINIRHDIDSYRESYSQRSASIDSTLHKSSEADVSPAPRLKLSPSTPQTQTQPASQPSLNIARRASVNFISTSRKVHVTGEDTGVYLKRESEGSALSSDWSTIGSQSSTKTDCSEKIAIVLGVLPNHIIHRNFPSLHNAILTSRGQYEREECSLSGAVEVTAKVSRVLDSLANELGMLVPLCRAAPQHFLRPVALMSSPSLVSNLGQSLDGLHALVSEKVEMSLETFLNSTRDVGVTAFKARLAVAYRMMSIVHVAHTHGIVLGDVQLSSFVVTRDRATSSPVIKFAGLEAALSIGTPLPPLYAGSLRSVAPEVACGRCRTAEPAQDVWALGIALVQVLSSSAGTSFWSFAPNATFADILNKYLKKITTRWVNHQLQRLFGDSYRTEYGILLKALLHPDPTKRSSLELLCDDFSELECLVSDFRFSLSFGYGSLLSDASVLSDLQMNSSSLRYCTHHHDAEHLAVSTLQTHLEYQLRLPLTVLSTPAHSLPSHFLLLPVGHTQASVLTQLQRKLFVSRSSYSKVGDSVRTGICWNTGRLVLIAIDAASGRHLAYGKYSGFEFNLNVMKGDAKEKSGWDYFMEQFKSALAYTATQLSILTRLYPDAELDDIIPIEYKQYLGGLDLQELELSLATTFDSPHYRYINSLFLELSSNHRRNLCMKVDGVSVESRHAEFATFITKLGFKISLLRRR